MHLSLLRRIKIVFLSVIKTGHLHPNGHEIACFSFFIVVLQTIIFIKSKNFQNQAIIPSIRPGDATASYISRVLFKITMIGATYLTIVAILPILMTVIFNLPSSAQIGGTSLIIVVGVALESWKQIKQSNQEKQYRGFIE